MSSLLFAFRLFLDKKLAKPIPKLGCSLPNNHWQIGFLKTALKNFAKWRAVIPDVNLEDFLNTQGYNALRNGKVADAIEIFKINTEEYPKSGNVWDSLGEAYLANKQYKLALEKYKQSLELDPTSENGKTMIKKIEEILKNQ